MAVIEKTIEIDASPDDVWAVVGDVGAIASWLPAIAQSSSSGGTRHCTMENGGALYEEITLRDDEARRYEYRIIDSPMPLEHHLASMSVEGSNGGSRVTWTTEVAPDELAGAMEPILDDGLQALKAHIEGAVTGTIGS